MFLFMQRDIVREICRRSPWPRAVNETKRSIELDVINQRHCVHEVFVGLARKTNNEVRGYGYFRAHLSKFLNDCPVFPRAVAALHQLQDAIRTALHRQVYMIHEFGLFGVSRDKPVAELDWMGCRKANPLHLINCRHVADQGRQIDNSAVVSQAAVRVHVLTQKHHFPGAVLREIIDFGDDVVERPAEFGTAGVGHDAEAAVFAAPFHDGDEDARALRPCGGKIVEFLDLGKADVDYGPGAIAHRGEQRWQSMQRLRAENNINERCTLPDVLALLGSDAAANADNQTGVGFLQCAPAPEFRKQLFLGFFSDRAGVHQ